MKFFKLELINRENSYNRMFNANPNVGVMNVLEQKVFLFYFVLFYFIFILIELWKGFELKFSTFTWQLYLEKKKYKKTEKKF